MEARPGKTEKNDEILCSGQTGHARGGPELPCSRLRGKGAAHSESASGQLDDEPVDFGAPLLLMRSSSEEADAEDPPVGTQGEPSKVRWNISRFTPLPKKVGMLVACTSICVYVCVTCGLPNCTYPCAHAIHSHVPTY
eukprot:1159066-Pelagomonas_calceolata.AAC.6